MGDAILIPIYKPDGKHKLLLKSVISHCRPNTKIYIFVDGQNASTVDDLDFSLFRMPLRQKNLEIICWKSLKNVGYPKCFAELSKRALKFEENKVFHFLDQDDYCLPNRFLRSGVSGVFASNILITKSWYKSFPSIKVNNTPNPPLLETLLPGMSFSLSRDRLDFIGIFYIT